MEGGVGFGKFHAVYGGVGTFNLIKQFLHGHAAVFIGLPGKAIYMIDRFWNTEDWEYVQSRR